MKTALIVSTNLGREDHGIMTFMLNIRTGSYGYMVGGYSLDEYQKSTKKKNFLSKIYGSYFKDFGGCWGRLLGRVAWKIYSI